MDLLDSILPPANVMLATGIGGSLAVVGGALALGIRHGIDWDHIAAITDITSTTAASHEAEEGWLTGEPGVMLTDESHHSLADPLRARAVAEPERAVAAPQPVPVGVGPAAAGPHFANRDVRDSGKPGNGRGRWGLSSFAAEQR